MQTLKEKEQKLLALYEEQAQQGHLRQGPIGGKVRQLFDERRGQSHHSGWNKRHPLDPILDRNLNVLWKQPVKRSSSQPRYDLQPSRSVEPLYQLAWKSNSPEFINENDYLSKSHDLELSSIFRKLPNIGSAPLSYSTDSKKYPSTNMAPANEQKLNSRIPNVGSVTKSLSKMSTSTKKTEIKHPAPTLNSQLKGIAVSVTNNKPRILTPPAPDATKKTTVRPASSSRVSEASKMFRGAAKTGTTASPAQRLAPAPTGGRTDLVPCRTCQRNFAPDRVQAHAEICAKTSRKKRKPFDVTKQRVKGTELEAYVKKGRASQPPPKKTEMLQPLTKSNWRRKHEEFISNIRAAKQVQAHIAKGGKLSDLPPPPPMDTSDLTPCPHCKRKFNTAAAERHIPKCANMLHNKPKPTTTAATKVKGTTKRF